MPEIESDPSQSTEMFRAFVERGAADQGSDEPAATTGRRAPVALIVGIVVAAVLLAAVIFLVL
jgi:hypothetical protein